MEHIRENLKNNATAKRARTMPAASYVLEDPRMAVSAVRQRTLNRALFQVLGGMDDPNSSLRLYSRASIQAAFSDVGTLTKKDITRLIAARLPELRHRLPRERQIWQSEDARQAIFDAAALALTCATQIPNGRAPAAAA